LVLALEKYFESEDLDIIAELYESINSMDIAAMPRLLMLERSILRTSEDNNMFEEKFIEMEERAKYHGRQGYFMGTLSSNKDRHYYETRVDFDRVRVPIRVPLAVFPEEIGDVRTHNASVVTFNI
jgi:hypothetical protein